MLSSGASLGALAPALSATRLSLHVLGAALWVGGQLSVAGMLPALRRLGPDASRVVARALARVLWPAYALLVATGVWNVLADHPSTQGGAWQAVLGVKLAVVLVSGLSAYAHQRARSRRALAAFGALAGTSAVAALVLGVVLAG